MHLLRFHLLASKQELKSTLKRLMYYASQGVKAVYSGSEWQYTAAGEV